MHLLLIFLPDHILCYLPCYNHDKDGGDNGNKDNRNPDGLEGRPRIQKSYGGRDEHDRHDLNEEIGGLADMFLFKDSCTQGQKHEYQPINACGDWKGHYAVEHFAQKRNKKDNTELA